MSTSASALTSIRCRLAPLLVGFAAFAVLATTGCGVGADSINTGISTLNEGPNSMGGILHGAPNPIAHATVTLYYTGSTYGTGTAVATTTTDQNGNFNLTLPTATAACPAGAYAYIGAYQGTTNGQSGSNPNALLMSVVGACSANYTTSSTTSGSATTYTNTYTGGSIWIDELTTAVSSYALSGFMSVNDAGTIGVGAPANNTATAATTVSAPAAAGLAHAFGNVANLINIHTGQPYAYTHGGTGISTGGVIPDAELFLLGNILQSCVNSTGSTGTNTATSTDGTNCGKLFSYVTPPQSGAAVPTNTLEAMLDLARYPNPAVNTWNAGCTAASSGNTTTATTCLFNLASSIAAPYQNALTSAPPDWTLAVVYSAGYGSNTTSTGCTTAGTCPGLVYPYYVALDYQDNIYVLNWQASSSNTATNIIGVAYDGTPLFSTAKDTTNTAIMILCTDTAGHVFGANSTSASSNNVPVYNTSNGSLYSSGTGLYTQYSPKACIADPFNNLYIAGQASINLRKLTPSGTSPFYTTTSATSTPPANAIYQMGIDQNYDLYEFEAPLSSGTTVYMVPNTNTSLSSAPTLSQATYPTAAITGTSTNAAGLAVVSGNNAYAIDSNGVTPVTKSGTGSSTTLTAGTATALPALNSGTLYSRYALSDGKNWSYSPDSANGTQVGGISVYDSTDALALGTYEGCFVVSKACGNTSATSPMYSPRAIGLDSAGDIWVVSGAGISLTELIGAAAPTWPGLSMAKFGLPQ